MEDIRVSVLFADFNVRWWNVMLGFLMLLTGLGIWDEQRRQTEEIIRLREERNNEGGTTVLLVTEDSDYVDRVV